MFGSAGVCRRQTRTCRALLDRRAGERTRTSTGIAHQVLSLARLPVPPRPRERGDPGTLLHVPGSLWVAGDLNPEPAD